MDTMTQVKYPQELLDLLTPDGFEAQFYILFRSGRWKSYEACYEELETKREHFFGQRYYSDYESFRKSRAYHHKKRKSV